MLLSGDKQSTQAEADENMALAKLEPENFICNPYALEFLYLKDYPNLHEKDIEEGLVTIYSPFCLTLAKDFALLPVSFWLLFGKLILKLVIDTRFLL